MKNISGPLVLAIVIACVLAACPAGPEGPPGPPGAHTVSFNLNGGSIGGRTSIPAETVVTGGKVQKPSDPIKVTAEAAIPAGLYRQPTGGQPGMIFEGWYNNNNLWDFNLNTVSGDITLRARWNPGEYVDTVTPNTFDGTTGAFTYMNANADRYFLVLDQNVTSGAAVATGQIFAANVHLAIAGKTPVEITRSANGLLFNLDAATESLTIGKNVTLMGRPSNSNCLVRVSGGATFTMLDGSKITGNTLTTYEGPLPYGASAVYVGGTGRFIMEGGTITGNTTSAFSGSAVNIYEAGTFIMRGGEITGNTGTSNATAPHAGAAVHLQVAGSTFIMEGGSITNNTGDVVGAVNVGYGTFTMTGGRITGNATTATGGPAASIFVGGVYVGSTGAAFTMKGGTISGNTTLAGNDTIADVLVHRTGAAAGVTGTLTMSGNSTIGVLTLTSSAANQGAVVRVPSPFTGKVNKLNLRGNNADLATAVGYWTGATVVQGYPFATADVGKFVLGNFYNNTTDSQPIARNPGGTSYRLQLASNNNTITLMEAP